MSDRPLSLRACADALGVDPSTAWRLRRQLNAFRVGRVWRVEPKDLIAYRERGRYAAQIGATVMTTVPPASLIDRIKTRRTH